MIARQQHALIVVHSHRVHEYFSGDNPRSVSVMGKVLTEEEEVARQLANSLREANDRLDRLIAEQERTNELLEWLGGLIVSAADRPAVRTSSVARRIELE